MLIVIIDKLHLILLIGNSPWQHTILRWKVLVWLLNTVQIRLLRHVQKVHRHCCLVELTSDSETSWSWMTLSCLWSILASVTARDDIVLHQSQRRYRCEIASQRIIVVELANSSFVLSAPDSSKNLEQIAIFCRLGDWVVNYSDLGSLRWLH